MASFVNGCVFTATSSGTGSFVVSAAATGWQTPAQAGASNGATYRYRAYSADNTQWEIGSGVYTTGTVTLTRALIEASSNGGSATNFTLPPAVALTMFDEDLAQPASSVPLGNLATGAVGTSLAYARADHVHPGREVLTANRTYYVRTDGSDSNTGLVDSAGGAFLTIQKAIDTAAGLDILIYDVTIQIGAGTYTTSVGLVAKQCVGAGAVILLGDETTPSNVVSTTNGAMTVSDGLFLNRNVQTTYRLKGITFSSTASGTVFGIAGSTNSYTEFQNIVISTGINQHIRADDGAIVKATGPYTIAAGGALHLTATAAIIRMQSITVTLTGTPAFSSGFAIPSRLGMILATAVTFSGSATGKRYTVTENAVAVTNGGGANYFPGDVAGTTGTGGQYN